MAAITAIQDNLTITLEEARAWCQVDDTTENTLVLELLIDAAKEDADLVCQNDFADQTGSGPGSGGGVTIPANIKVWCLQRVKRNFERRAEGLEIDQVNGLGGVNWSKDEEIKPLLHWRKTPGF